MILYSRGGKMINLYKIFRFYLTIVVKYDILEKERRI